MKPSPTTDLNPDCAAISAIRGGDRHRYREPVERYGDKVFAVAWCRLGDGDLAEEAAQEAFIHGYHRLALLDNAEKFGAWITAIARNAAINLECLALFYLEEKTVAEAAAFLGLSETAFTTRLHRARTALRTQLRMDYSMFLRDAKGLLPASEPATGASYTATDLFRFAQFMGSRFLVFDWKTEHERLELRLTPVSSKPLGNLMPAFWHPFSTVTLCKNGRVETHLNQADQRRLMKLHGLTADRAAALDPLVSQAVASALRAYTGGDEKLAEANLGQEPNEVIYRIDPARAGGAMWRTVFLVFTGFLMICQGYWNTRKQSPAVKAELRAGSQLAEPPNASQ
ncbi:MAG: sigW 15 [Chthoniobacteraceae bacterium]|nr:sigW 15 [Chthoniobacteraceae bacterium]